ncbi:MAG: hypothetical protein C0468_04535 [Planctomyces sp.]|nr:hypothetical protein [Planctomyces sp.]
MLAADSGRRLALDQLGALPEYDWAAHADRLLASGHTHEARAALAAAIEDEPDPARRAALTERLDRAPAARWGPLDSLRELGIGALTGTGGTTPTIERLVGAVATDMLVIGDLRDLGIQGVRWAIDGQADAVIVGLSALGLATTLTPAADAGVALLKLARRGGSMPRALADELAELLRLGRRQRLTAIAADAHALERAWGGAAALRVVRTSGSSQDLARAARLARGTGAGPRGARAMTTLGPDGARWLADAQRAGASEADTAAVILAAGRKGDAGRRWLAGRAGRALLRPHPLLGALKALSKGTGLELAQRALRTLGPHAGWLIPALIAWIGVESWWLARRLTRRPIAPTPR